MKKILFLYGKGTNELINRQSALGSYIYCLASLLQQCGYEIWINGIELSLLKQLEEKSNPVGKSGIVKKLIPSFIKQFIRDKNLFSAHKKICNEIPNNINFEKVIEFYTYGSTLGIQQKDKYKCPYILIFDSPVLEEYEFFHGKKKLGRHKIINNQNASLRAADHIVVYSNAVKKYVSQITLVDENISIHQNVDFTRFEFLEPRKVEGSINIGFVGSFLKWHRVDLLIDVFESLSITHKNLRLYLIGAGMEYQNICKRAASSPVFSQIELTGFCDGENLLEMKKKLHIGVMPGSNWYGAPNKIFEYGAAGLAVLAPRTPTISDIFNDSSGVILFKQDDKNDFFHVLKSYIENPELLTKNANRLQEMIRENYSEKHTIDYYVELIEKTVDAK